MRRTIATLFLILSLTSCESGPGTIFSPNLFGVSRIPAAGGIRIQALIVEGFLDGRRCWVYLPPGYDPANSRYPVLYLHDGQDVFRERQRGVNGWDVARTSDSLIAAGVVAPLIIVGIPHSGTNRFNEYVPFPSSRRGDGGGGDAYLRAIRDALKPAVDRRFATLPDQPNTCMAGASLGGLISVYAGYAYSETFGRIGSFSGSFGWDSGEFYSFIESRTKPPLSKLYLDSGTVFDNLGSARRMRDIAVSQGFVLGDDLFYLEAEGHDHSDYYFGLRMTHLLAFLSPSGDPGPLPGEITRGQIVRRIGGAIDLAHPALAEQDGSDELQGV